jgi:hypothetical protein
MLEGAECGFEHSSVGREADVPPGPPPIADRVVRLQMAAAAARLYPKVLERITT